MDNYSYYYKNAELLIRLVNRKLDFLFDSHLILWEDQIRCILNNYFPKDITSIILKIYMEEYKRNYAGYVLKEFSGEEMNIILEQMKNT